MFLAEYDEKQHIENEKQWSRQEGQIEGKSEGKAECILDILSDLGKIPEELRNHIMQERNPDRVSRWFRASRSVRNIEEFISRM